MCPSPVGSTLGTAGTHVNEQIPFNDQLELLCAAQCADLQRTHHSISDPVTVPCSGYTQVAQSACVPSRCVDEGFVTEDLYFAIKGMKLDKFNPNNFCPEKKRPRLL
ncbi:hypothetical protein F442_09998 [Phytophthora nicotianae P10297]|uniref:Uncharacterized protein n=1 Tax=Phytophthora nicotianae P10297 TaxID=1317064 RepID=W2Z7D4_PHYNI|nr:hypothetical protein F442_09998 [Phytophthora nicotianae P10297]